MQVRLSAFSIIVFYALGILQGCTGVITGQGRVPPDGGGMPRPSNGVSVQDRSTFPETQGMEDQDTACSYFYFLWGRYAELQLEFEAALEAYEKAVICDPASPFLSRKIPLVLMKMNRQKEAQSWLESYLKDNPEAVSMRLLLARSLVGQNEIDRAITQYEMLCEQYPDRPGPHLLLAELYLSHKDFSKTRAILEKMIDAHLNPYAAKILMAQSYEAQKKISQAVSWYKEALAENWSSQVLMAMGKLLVEEEQYLAAIASFREILERDQYDEHARLALIQVYQLQGHEEQTLAELEKLRSFSEQPAMVDLAIARLYARKEEYTKAIEILEKRVANGSLPEAEILLARLYYRTGQNDLALEKLETITVQEELFTDALSLKVHILQELDRSLEAIQLVEKQLGQPEARSPELYAILALLYHRQGQEDMVEMTYARGMAEFPWHDQLLYEYGLFFDSRGDREAAIEIMQKVITLNPDNVGALNYIGYSWADASTNLDQALSFIQKAVSLRPNNGYIRDSLGWVYFKMGEIDRAVTELEKAVELVPEDATIREHLGDAYLEKGMLPQALATYKKAGQLEKEDSADPQNLREKIQMIEKRLVP
ncbi:MAG: hypothetical protein CSA33_08305 [Desulfobulbus propionicus]|nr:MAG: hypothetical protein CSA33_08305 [Desulfobulbus propionicus]